jgi:four helix bundle suffix protein
MICLIHQTNYLLDQQLRDLEKALVNEGGLGERMTRARLDSRNGRGRLNKFANREPVLYSQLNNHRSASLG